MLLKIGSTGDDVVKLQTKLGITADGSFGPNTEAKVKEWQSQNGLTADGVVGDITWAKLFPASSTTIPASNFKLQNLSGHIPDAVITQIPGVAPKFNITSPLRLAHFLAQCSHESGNFRVTVENLNYSVDGLKRVFPSYFPGDLANSYSMNPSKIASRVYGSLMGNGDEASGDGYKFRGRGYIQLTGKNNYTKFAAFIGEDTVANPDLVASKYPLASAAFYFNSNNLWTTSDAGADEATVTAVTRRVNGGTNGLDDRLARFNEYYPLLK